MNLCILSIFYYLNFLLLTFYRVHGGSSSYNNTLLQNLIFFLILCISINFVKILFLFYICPCWWFSYVAYQLKWILGRVILFCYSWFIFVHSNGIVVFLLLSYLFLSPLFYLYMLGYFSVCMGTSVPALSFSILKMVCFALICNDSRGEILKTALFIYMLSPCMLASILSLPYVAVLYSWQS